MSRRAQAAAESIECDLLSPGLLTERHLWHLGATFAGLQSHLDAPVSKTGFESTLRLAFEDCGHAVSVPTEQTHAGHDLTIDGVRLSLKTEASQNIQPRLLRISKLMEAAWSKDFTSVDDAAAAVGRVLDHLSGYERILVLRAFSEPAAISYELVEIPHGLLASMGTLTARDFSPLTANGSTKAVVGPDRPGGRRRADIHFRLIFDGSANKVSIKSLRRDLCIVHARWRIARMGCGARTVRPVRPECFGGGGREWLRGGR